MKRVEWVGNIKKGKLEILDREAMAKAINFEFGPSDCIVDIIIEKCSKKRSTQQNKYLWGVCYKLLSDHLGYTPEEIHEICKYKFLRKHYDIGKEHLEVGSTTKTLSTLEFEDYTENIRMFGATLSVNIPLPNEMR
jgi:hypothetical protein